MKNNIAWTSFVVTVLPAVCLCLTGCGSKTVPVPPAGTTASGGLMTNPQASAAVKAQAAQQVQLAQREQQLMRQTHPAAPQEGSP